MKSLIASICILGLVGMVVGVAVKAADTAPVTATVTPQVIAVSVEDGSVDYGILNVGESNATFEGTATSTQTIASQSNVPTDIAVKSGDAIGQTVPWSLVSATTTAGANTFVHYYDIDVGAGPAVWTDFPDDNNYTGTVVTLPLLGDTATLDLKIDMPTSITDSSVHSIIVTVLATETP